MKKSLGEGYHILLQIEDQGDIAECYADPTKAFKELDWKAEKSLEDMCRDAWRWQVNNPNGYDDVNKAGLDEAVISREE